MSVYTRALLFIENYYKSQYEVVYHTVEKRWVVVKMIEHGMTYQALWYQVNFGA